MVSQAVGCSGARRRCRAGMQGTGGGLSALGRLRRRCERNEMKMRGGGAFYKYVW